MADNKNITKFFVKYKYEILVIILTLIVNLTFLSRLYVEDIALPHDSFYYYKILLSMVKDHDIEVSNNIFNDVYEYDYDMHFSPFSRGKDDKIYPKHPVVLPFTAIPFYLLFKGNNDGKTSVLIYAIFSIVLIHLITFEFLQEYFDTRTSLLTIILILFSSPIIKEVSFSNDLLIVLLVLGGSLFIQKKQTCTCRFNAGSFSVV